MSTESPTDLDAARAAIARHAAVMVFKHSPICPASTRALAEWERFVAAHPQAETLFIDVIAGRPVARGLSAACGVPHASPQAILFRGGRPVWNASHDAITAASLASAWAG